jgi:hypothetical protein
MATIAKGVGKVIGIKRETTWGTLAGDTGAKLLRRVTSNFNLTKESYESNEIRSDYQVADMRHGVRSVEGSLNGELSPGTYSDFFAAVVAKDFASVTAISSLSVTIAASSDFFTITDGTATFITDGVKVGDIIALTGAGLDPDNVANNLLVVTLSETVATVKVLSSTPLVAEGPIASVTMTVRGKRTNAPLTGHTDDSFTVEEFYSDINQSEVFVGNKVGSVAVQLPASGLVTCDVSMMGRDLAQTGTSQYFTSPTALNTNGITASVEGALVVNGVAVALLSSLDFTIDRGIEMAPVVGSNLNAAAFTGRIRVNGNFSSYFIDGVFRDYFNSESTVSLVVALTTSNAKDAHALSFTFPKIKVNSATKDDGENGIMQQQSFVALLNDSLAGGLIQSTVQINDTSI